MFFRKMAVLSLYIEKNLRFAHFFLQGRELFSVFSLQFCGAGAFVAPKDPFEEKAYAEDGKKKFRCAHTPREVKASVFSRSSVSFVLPGKSYGKMGSESDVLHTAKRRGEK